MNDMKKYLSEFIIDLGEKHGFKFSFFEKGLISHGFFLFLEVVLIERKQSSGNERNKHVTSYGIQPRCTLKKIGEVNANYLLAASDEFARAAAFMQEFENSPIGCLQRLRNA